MDYAIGVDIGGTKCAVILGYYDKLGIYIEKRVVFSTCSLHGPDEIIACIIVEIENLLKTLNQDSVKGIGISCGGPLDSKNGIIKSPPNLIGWDNIHIVDILVEKFRMPIKIQNDANACALAEWKYGAGINTKNMVFLTFGTGMGAGIILDGHLYCGTSDMAGEIGHLRIAEHGPVGYGKIGSFEGFCSGAGIAQLAKSKVLEKLQQGKTVTFCKGINDLESINAKMIGGAAEEGDPLAREIYAECGRYLGYGLSIIIDILNPEVIVIGSIFVRSYQLLWPNAKEIIDREALDGAAKVCRVVPAALGEQIGDIAALSVIL
jgi:glucokinase